MKKSTATLVAVIGFGLFAASFFYAPLAAFKWLFLLFGLAAFTIMPENKAVRSASGTIALVVLLYFGVQLIQKTSVGRQNIDLTEDSRYTLTKGTKAILGELDEPVTINYYVSRDLRSTPADVKRYIPRVDSLLEEFESLAKDGNLTVNFIDPKPNTDEEDAAELDQIVRTPVSTSEDLFFGASVTAWDKKTTIPVFNPQNETQLEFDLVSAIAEVSRLNKPMVGLVTPLDVTSGGQSGQGWVFYQFLKRQYNVADLGMDIVGNLEVLYSDNEWGDAPDHLDPEKIPVLLVLHPAGISEEAQFHLDQYLLRGGTVVAALDSFSYAAQAMGNQRPMIPGMPPQGGPPTDSNLPTLLSHYGIEFSGQEVLADGKYGQPNNPAVLSLDKDAIGDKDALALNSINDIFYVFPGAFTKVTPKDLRVSRLLKSSNQSSLVNAQEASNPRAGENLRFKLRSSDRSYDLALHLSGEFTTAFPKGNPTSPNEEPEDEKPKADKNPADDEKADAEKTAEVAENPKPEVLAKAKSSGNLYLFSDADFLFDGAAYRMLRIAGLGQGGGLPQQISDNGPLVFNILDQAGSSSHLVGARARTPSFRPFTVFKEMQTKFREKAGKEIDKLRKEEEAATARIQALQAARKDQNNAFLTAEQADEIKKLREQQVNLSKNIREIEKDYQSSEDAIKAGIFWKSLLIVPVAVIVVGLLVYLFRRMSTKAR